MDTKTDGRGRVMAIVAMVLCGVLAGAIFLAGDPLLATVFAFFSGVMFAVAIG